MANPRLKKNPLMSMWLSNANATAGRARSIASAEIGKQQAELTKQTVRFWTRAWQTPIKPRRHRYLSVAASHMDDSSVLSEEARARGGYDRARISSRLRGMLRPSEET